MSDKVVGKIFVTSWKNYKKFRDNENNRNLDERHVAKLVASFRKNGWDIEPITVNKDYVIISGHHRLAAAVQAEIDIKYTIADVDYTSTQLQDISSTQKKWTERDVIASKAKAGSIAHQNYIQLDKKYVATKILKPNTLVAVITNNYTTGSVAKIKSDDIIQTMWLNSKEPDSPYIQNLGYTENSAYDRGHALVTKFKDTKIFTRYDKYSCVEDGLVRLLHGNTMTYIAGWESDACVLGTCFDLFDKGVPFRIVTDCIASERQNAHEAALVIMNRNFGKVTLIKSEEV